jgi:hypothetical protein
MLSGPPLFHSNPHQRSVSVASIAHLTSSNANPVQHSRKGSTPRQERYTHERTGSGSGSGSHLSHEEDEVDQDDDFLAHQIAGGAVSGKRKDKAR